MSGGSHQRGAVSIYLLLLMAFVLFGFLAMAVDVGRLYLVQAELQTAADAAALAAATRLVGTANSHVRASDQVAAAFDSTTGNDNRFNLRMNPLGISGSDLLTEILVDYFSTPLDAQGNVNGAQSGAQAKYARVEVRAETPVLFTRFLSPDWDTRQMVAAAAIAGVSSPVCVACGIDALAVVAPPDRDEVDEENYGFVPDEYYTLYLTPSQQGLNIPGCLSLSPPLREGTLAVAQYIILDHLPGGPETLPDGELFRLGAGGMASTPGLDPPGTVTIGTPELAKPNLQVANCLQSRQFGGAFLCGLNDRFGVHPSENACGDGLIADVSDLEALYAADSHVAEAGVLQPYATEYDGNLRRVLTVAVVDSADTLTVLGFRQFLLQNLRTAVLEAVGLAPAGLAVRVARDFRAQYLGRPVPLRCGAVGGSCNVAFGVGRTVLH